MATKKPMRGQRAKTNAQKRGTRAGGTGSGSTTHRIKHTAGPKVKGSEKPPRNLQRLRKKTRRDS
tara:strand:+ start:2341 stop:2535 length:195 start_codon:yes stop_codon:yes gene_type:complete